ncbi:hypothetical protein EXN66_Car009252 [Channa argus]|uniref:Uncharacterized protein n=1 Tax=Channa argus TaxID=215402 RepID=A0A6G1PUA6_CHAAH|nr:hypothetical protein EXN66_Car009252 [Channa argus]
MCLARMRSTTPGPVAIQGVNSSAEQAPSSLVLQMSLVLLLLVKGFGEIPLGSSSHSNPPTKVSNTYKGENTTRFSMIWL